MKRAIYDQAERLRLVAACQRADSRAEDARLVWAAHVMFGGGKRHARGMLWRARRVVAKTNARRAHRALEAFDKRERTRYLRERFNSIAKRAFAGVDLLGPRLSDDWKRAGVMSGLHSPLLGNGSSGHICGLLCVPTCRRAAPVRE